MEKASQTIPIILSLIAAILGALAQYFYKIGSVKIDEIGILKNYYLFSGVISFTLVLILFIFSFRMGGRMFVVYPVYATTYIWGGLIAHYWVKEPISHFQLIGVALIMAGVSVISIQPSN